MKQAEIDENQEVVEGVVDGVWAGMEFGKQNPLSTLDVFYDGLILSELLTPSEQD